MQATGEGFGVEPRAAFGPGLRHVTILFSDIAGFSELTQRLGDIEASHLSTRFLLLEEIIITRDGLGQVLHFSGDSLFAVFDHASVALNRALEIQRVLDSPCQNGVKPHVRIGLHMGEVLVREGERLEIISRHVNRAHRVMEAAAPGQILASEGVVDAARDFIDIPREHRAIQHYGEFYLKGVGATSLCEVADLRFRNPEPPRHPDQAETRLISRLELAGYRSVSRLGEGATGVVYRATRENSNAEVAVKVLNPSLCEDPQARERFAKEVERTRSLNLPGVVRIIETRLDHQPPFFVMELVKGRPADIELENTTPERIARLFESLCATLQQAHAAGVIHCDLKPANVLVRDDDSAVITDFGMAILSSTTSKPKASSTHFLSAPAFIAPEMIQGGTRGPQTDVYSLGAMLFKMLTGREPFVAETVHQILQAHVHEDPPPPALLNPQVSDGLQRICLKALEKSPAERYHSAGEMGADLSRFLRGEIIRTRPTVYDNLLFHRVEKHVHQIKEWRERGLLSAEESHRLLSSYEGLQRRGLPAVMEGRLFRLWQTLVYIGGWAVVNGSLLWLMQHWDTLSRTSKLLLGSVPAITTFALAAAMWRMERFRLFFVALIVAILATPLLTGVWLHEFEVVARVPPERLKFEVFHNQAGSKQITNEQIMLTALVTLVVAGGVMRFTRTATHSAQAVAALAVFYTACLLSFGLRPHVEQNEWAKLSLKYLPLLLATSGMVGLLLQREERYYQAPPWVYFTGALTLAITATIALHGLQEWAPGLSPEYQKPVSLLLLSVAGAIQATLGLAARSFLRHRCRTATLGVIFAGLVAVIAGVGIAGWKDVWPANWWTVVVFGKQVPFPHVALPAAALTITLLACRYQLFAFLMVGLAGLAFSIHGLGYLYFDEVPAWPRVLMAAGAVCFFMALYRELRGTRGNTIDDVVSQTRL